MRKVLIIGGVAGGASIAARLRRLDEKAEIILFERGEHISYANCGLPYYLGGSIADHSKLFVMTPESFRNTLNVDVRNRQEVISIDTKAQKIQITKKATNEVYWESYDELVLSPGAEPIRPGIPGIQHERIYSVRSVPDIEKIKQFVDTQRPKRAIVVGGGFIGLEMAENLRERGLSVALVEAQDQVMVGLDFEMAALVHHQLVSKKIELYLRDSVQGFSDVEGKVEVSLQSETKLRGDLVILAIGVKPDTAWMRACGIPLDVRGYIEVDTRMRTSVEHIYALGDAVLVKNPITGNATPVPLAGPANKQARIVAEQIVYGDQGSEFKGSIGTAVAKIFDWTIACTGIAEKVCKRDSIPCESVILHPNQHAGYYPGAKPLTLKVIFHRQTGKILGAQAVGSEGVDKRIDVLSAFIQMGASVEQLAEFEQSYAPPYSSAKDPINYAGFIASNILKGLTQQVSWDRVDEMQKQGVILLDVRTREEFELGHLEGALNISNLDIRSRLSELQKEKTILIYCGVGLRGYLAERILRENGYDKVFNLKGGYKTYVAATTKPERPVMNADLPFQDGTGMPAPLANVSKDVVLVDACGLQCPGPIMQLKLAMDKAFPGSRLLVRATDGGFVKDAKAWCNLTGNLLVSLDEKAGVFEAVIEKAIPSLSGATPAPSVPGLSMNSKEASLIVFSNDLDRALASFVIANGAAASGKKVTMFFTFWGLSVIRKREKVPVKKDFMGRMFDMMLPRSVHQLALSKMNFGGAGAVMMKKRMEAKSVEQLEVMMQSAKASGVRMVACLMSMDIMGVAKEELIDGVEIGGVATYLEAASTANINLFI